MQPIAKVEDKVECGLYVRHIFGLNIFRANKVEASPDPRVTFLSTLCEKFLCAAHIDTVAMEGEQPEEFFGSTTQHDYIRTPIGLSGGLFYQVQETEMLASFFPVVRSSLLEKHGDYLLKYDALALYIAASDTNDQTFDAMQGLLTEPPPFENRLPKVNHRPSEEGWAVIHRNQARWLQAALQFCALVVLSGGDGWELEVYALDKANLDMTDFALTSATHAIQSSSWYQKYQQSLQWDDERDQCLKPRDRVEV